MFDKQITEFNNNLLSLRDFVELIEPILLDRQTKSHGKVSPFIWLSKVKRLINSDKTTEEEKNILIEKRDKLISLIYEKFEGSNSCPEDEKQDFLGLKLSQDSLKTVIDDWNDYDKQLSHIQLLYKNSLISLLSSVEWFFAQILHYYYDKYPTASGINKKELTFENLKTFETINDAQNYLIEEKIESILRGNIESWFEHLKKDLKLSMGYLSDNLKELIEISQRRNLIVHNGGVINSIYLTKVDESLIKGIKINDPLSINKLYLEKSISKLQVTFILIASELWKNLDSDHEERGTILGNIVYDNLLNKRWDIAQSLSIFITKDAKLPQMDKTVAQFNLWLCKKRLGKKDEVIKEVDKVDFSDRRLLFQIAVFAIKDDFESFFAMLPLALDTDELDIDKLEKFPLFEDIRSTDDYITFKSTSKYFELADQQAQTAINNVADQLTLVADNQESGVLKDDLNIEPK